MASSERTTKDGGKGSAGPWKPTGTAIAAARGETVPDLIAPGLRVLFCGINPSLYSAAVGHHFARPGNRFWPTLHAAGLTDRRLNPFEEQELLRMGFGITNIVDVATARADELSPDQLVAGRRRLEAKVRRQKPRVLAVLGVTAYRAAFARPRAVVGPQDEAMAGTLIWVLPNPSGLNASFSLDQYHSLRRYLDSDLRAGRSPSP